jgi:hypothetical protein
VELENRIAGLGACGAQRTETPKERAYDGEISAIYVLKAFQRHAIGTRLLFALASDRKVAQSYGLGLALAPRANDTATSMARDNKSSGSIDPPPPDDEVPAGAVAFVLAMITDVLAVAAGGAPVHVME